MKISQFSALAFIPIALLQLFVVKAQLLTDSNAQNLNTALGQKVQYTFLDSGSSDDQVLHLPSTTSSSNINTLTAGNSTGSATSSSLPKVTSSVISSMYYQSANTTITTQYESPSSANQTTSSKTSHTINSSTSTGGAGSIKPCFYFVLMLETIGYLFY